LRTLFIVDIQQKYKDSFSENYLNDVKDFIYKDYKNFDKIVCIMENNKILGDYIPEEINEKLTIYPIFKCYDAEYTYNVMRKSKNFEIDEEGCLVPLIEIPEGDFCIREGKGFFVGKRDDTNVSIDYMGKDLYLLMNLLRYDDIYLIGGGLNNCVEKTKNYLHFLGIDSQIIKKLCYTIDKKSESCPNNHFNVFIKNNQKE